MHPPMSSLSTLWLTGPPTSSPQVCTCAGFTTSSPPPPHVLLRVAVKLHPSLRSSIFDFVESLGEFSPEQIEAVWVQVRKRAIAPALQVAILLCLVMSVMLMLEAMYMSAVSLGVKLLHRTPETRYRWEPISGDEELGSLAYPMVLVQIPMYNEKEVDGGFCLSHSAHLKRSILPFPLRSALPVSVKLQVYKLSIGAACALTWPPDRIIIQVLDDSTDPMIKKISLDYHFKVEQESGSSSYAFFGFNAKEKLSNLFFFVRRVVAPIVTFAFYCIVIPVSVVVPELSSHNAILDFVRERHVHAPDESSLDRSTGDLNTISTLPSPLDLRVSFLQLGFAVFLMCCASYNVVFGVNYYYVYIYLQAFAFVVMGFGYVGTFTTNS
ncbi:hypothetical protein BHE74_00007855 [Ensete ventricosum]|nr:hypothetical protein BHE74_00007855 [Ensete ventricosum]